MNHDYAHCLDYTENCPMDCFRAELKRDIEENRSEFIGVPLTYAHLAGTDECKLVKDKDVTCKMSFETDCIGRQAAIEEIARWAGYIGEDMILRIQTGLKKLPSVQTDVRPIDYQDCSDALLKMWMDNVVTDGEYWRIMDKLNAHWENEG